GEGLPLAWTMKLGARPNKYRPSPELQKLFVIRRRFFTISKFSVDGTSLSRLCENAILPMTSGASLGIWIPLIRFWSSWGLIAVANAAGRIGIPPPPDPPKY